MIVPEGSWPSVWESFQKKAHLSLRINTLKIQPSSIVDELKNKNINFNIIPWAPHAVIVESGLLQHPQLRQWIEEGKIYVQSLSSMLIPCVLGPQSGERILDLCAAPGSKASQMAAMMKNEGIIHCVENIKGRFYRLKSVLALLGVENARITVMDGRRFRYRELFDKILVDAPCSSEGRFHLSNPKSFAYWSPRKIDEMVQKQRGLVMNASRLLKPGGVMVYATCTFAPEENEGVVDWLLRKTDGQMRVVPIGPLGIETYPALKSWKKKEYNAQVEHCLRILPNEIMDGFFITKFVKAGTILP